MVHDKIVKDLFNVFHNKIYGYKGLTKDNKEKEINNFLTKLHKKYGLGSIGIHFLSDYFCYQWNYWNDKKKLEESSDFPF